MGDNNNLDSLLHQQLSLWRDEAKSRRHKWEKEGADLDQLEEKISAAEKILGVPQQRQETGDVPLKSLISDLMEDGVPRSTREIRDRLVLVGVDPERVSTRSNYFYTALTHMVHAGTLRRAGGKYVLPEETEE